VRSYDQSIFASHHGTLDPPVHTHFFFFVSSASLSLYQGLSLKIGQGASELSVGKEVEHQSVGFRNFPARVGRMHKK
jgi:hypothetical protein